MVGGLSVRMLEPAGPRGQRLMTTNVEAPELVSAEPVSETAKEARPGRWAWLVRLILKWQEAQYLNWVYGFSENGEDP